MSTRNQVFVCARLKLCVASLRPSQLFASMSTEFTQLSAASLYACAPMLAS